MKMLRMIILCRDTYNSFWILQKDFEELLHWKGGAILYVVNSQNIPEIFYRTKTKQTKQQSKYHEYSKTIKGKGRKRKNNIGTRAGYGPSEIFFSGRV